MRRRTSQTDPIRIDTVQSAPGELGLTLCPGKQGPALDGAYWLRDLDSDLESIRHWGPALIIGLMEPQEYEMLKVADITGTASRHGLRYEIIAIPDGDPPGPAALQRWSNLASGAHQILDAGGRVLIHCRGGLGRTGTLAAMILVERGVLVGDAIRLVRAARHGAIETESQEQFLAPYVRPEIKASKDTKKASTYIQSMF